MTAAGFLQIGPHRLEYAWQGEPGPRAMVLLHEGLGCVGLWRDFPGELSEAAGLPVFAYSRPNYGRSSPSAPLPRPVRYMHAEALSLASIAKAREAYERGDLRARLSRWHEHVDAAFWGWNGPWLHPGFRGWNLTGCLGSIRAPALLIQGAADEYGTLAQIEAIQRGLPSETETLILPDAGHSPHYDLNAAVPTATAR